jgi:hypothetical protein
MNEEFAEETKPEALEEEAFDETTENAFSLRQRDVDTSNGVAQMAYVVC